METKWVLGISLLAATAWCQEKPAFELDKAKLAESSLEFKSNLATAIRSGVLASVNANLNLAMPLGVLAEMQATSPGPGGSSRADADYQRAQRALDQKQYDTALRRFEEIIAQKGPRTDAALYWKAYAESRLNRGKDALATLDSLKAAYPASRWMNDAQALQMEIKQMSGQPVTPESTTDEDLKLMAINGLMQSDPDRAFPTLEKLLQGTASPKVKERALFVLSQSGSDRSRDLLVRVAKGGSNPDLQRKAITTLGMNGRRNGDLLAEIYNSSTDLSVRKSVLQAYMISGDKEHVSALARTEKDPDLRRDAIHQLGAMGDRKGLADLYAAEQDANIKKQILNAMFVAGDADKLNELVKAEKDPTLRRSAIQFLGMTGRPGAQETLAAMYGSETDAGTKKQILNALFVGGNSKLLIELARKETNLDMKKQMVQYLSMMRSKEANDYMLELLNK